VHHLPGMNRVLPYRNYRNSVFSHRISKALGSGGRFALIPIVQMPAPGFPVGETLAIGSPGPSKCPRGFAASVLVLAPR